MSALAAHVHAVRSHIAGPALLVYREMHLFGTEDRPSAERKRLLLDAAEPLESELVTRLGEIARDADAWLVPGTVCELGPGGELFNTALVFSPDGQLVGAYRKVFPWRPYEP